MRKRKLLILSGAIIALISATLVAQPVTKVYLTSGGNKIVVASGGTMDVESGGLFQIAGTTVTATAAQLNASAAVTAGTVTASKTVVVDANKDIGDFRNLDATNVDLGLSGTAGSLDIFPATAASGKIAITAANSAGDTTTTITNASQAGARTYTIPDAGASASFVMTEGAATINGIKTLDNNGLKIEDSDATHGVTISPGNETADRVLSIPVLAGADIIATLATAQTVSGVKTFSADPVTSVGVGVVAGAGVALVENGNGAFHKTVFTLTSVSITVTDSGGVNGGQGGIKIYDFPEGVIVRGGCVANGTTLAGAGGIADGGAVVLALGTTTAAADNSTLTTTEADFIASYAGTLVAGAGDFEKYGEPSVTSLDGHTTAVDLFLNMAVPDADISANDTLAVSGTITCTWWNNGDWT